MFVYKAYEKTRRANNTTVVFFFYLRFVSVYMLNINKYCIYDRNRAFLLKLFFIQIVCIVKILHVGWEKIEELLLIKQR